MNITEMHPNMINADCSGPGCNVTTPNSLVTSGGDEQGFKLATDYIEYKIGIIIEYLFPYGFASVGILTNMLTILVLSKKGGVGSSSSTLYLFAIAVCDTIYCWTDIIDTPIGNSITKTTWFCKLVYYLSYVAAFTSDCTVLALAIDRALVVCYPHKAKVLSTPLRAKVTILTIFLVECVINSEALISLTVEPQINACVRILKYA